MQENDMEIYVLFILFQTMEGRSIVIARRLTKQLRTGLSTFSLYVPQSIQPAALRERLQQTYKYTEDLYTYFRDVSKKHDGVACSGIFFIFMENLGNL